MPAVTPNETEVARRVVEAIQKVRRQKQRPTADRIHHMLERDGDTVTSSEVSQLLDVAVNSGAVERIYNTSGIVSYKELAVATNSASIVASKSSGSSVVAETPLPRLPETKMRLPETKPKSKKSESSTKESKKAGKKPSSHHSLQLSIMSHETVSADCKPTLVVDKHTDLSDVVLQVILRLGCASGKAVEKDIRSHYRLDMYPGVDIRRHIRSACKSLVRQEQLRQDGNNFVLKGDDDDAADVTLTVDEPTIATDKSVDPQVEKHGVISIVKCAKA